MKRKLQLKQKIMIGAGAGLLGATAIATPLAITLSKSHNNMIDDLDNQYGIDRTVYNNMKGDLTNKYRSNLEEQHVTDIDAKMSKLASSLAALDKVVQEYDSESHYNTYVVATSALMQKAKFDYDVDLVRNSRANWNEVEDMFKGMSKSFDTYMSNHSFDRKDIDKILANATNLKIKLVNQLKTEYANDILGGVLKAKTQLLSCFDAINTEIARLAAETRLVEFNSNYRFEYIERISEDAPYTANRFDVMKATFTKGAPISNDIMNKLFKCYNVTTRQQIDFDSDKMIPGYKLIPVFAGTVENPITNEYAIQIDWAAVSQNFVESEDAEKATAHLIDVDQQLIDDVTTNKDKINSIDDFFNNHANKKIRLTNYEMLVTAGFESQKLAETYFDTSANSANIEFVWDPRFNPCYDGFMYLDQSSTKAQTLNLWQLAMTNIAIKANGCEPRLLKDVIATVEQDDYEPKDMIENFVKNCDIVDTVQIIRSSDDITVTNNFTANYKNQVRWDTHGQESIGATSFGTTMHAENLEISEVFFEQANTEYNMQRNDSDILLSNEYNKLYDDAELVSDVSALSVSVQITAQIIFLGQTVLMFIKKDFFIAIVSLLLNIAAGYTAYLEVKRARKFDKDFLDPMKKYKEKADEFRAEKSLIDSVKKEINDGLAYFVVIDGDHPYDPQTYNEKLTLFRGLSKEKQQEIFNKYHYFKIQNPAKEFFDEAERLHVNPIQFREDFAEWKNPTGGYARQNLVISILMDLTLASAMVLAHVAKNEKPVGAQKEVTKKAQKTMEWLINHGKKFDPRKFH